MSDPKTTITLATATPGGGFPLYGGVLAEVVNAVDPSLNVECRNTKGSTENVPLLEAGSMDLGLVTGEVAIEPFARKSGLTVAAAMYSTAGMFVLRGDSPARSISDLKGKPVAFGARGSGLVILARYVLDGIGLDMERDFTAIYLDRAGDGPDMVLDGRAAAGLDMERDFTAIYLDRAGDGPDMVLDGRAAALWGGGVGWPGFARVAGEGGRFIAPDAGEIGRIRAKHAFLKPLTVPAGAYPGQGAAIHSVGSWAFILARPGWPDDAGYRFARALHKGAAALGEKLAQARETTAANTAAAAPEPGLIHPGVARYLREIGVLS